MNAFYGVVGLLGFKWRIRRFKSIKTTRAEARFRRRCGERDRLDEVIARANVRQLDVALGGLATRPRSRRASGDL